MDALRLDLLGGFCARTATGAAPPLPMRESLPPELGEPVPRAPEGSDPQQLLEALARLLEGRFSAGVASCERALELATDAVSAARAAFERLDIGFCRDLAVELAGRL